METLSVRIHLWELKVFKTSKNLFFVVFKPEFLHHLSQEVFHQKRQGLERNDDDLQLQQEAYCKLRDLELAGCPGKPIFSKEL